LCGERQHSLEEAFGEERGRKTENKTKTQNTKQTKRGGGM